MRLDLQGSARKRVFLGLAGAIVATGVAALAVKAQAIPDAMLPRALRARPPLDTYAKVRVQAVNAHLQQAGDAYILIAGDSHVERTFLPHLCGWPVVNAGIGGATAGDIAQILPHLDLDPPPRAVVLTVGTNDARNVARQSATVASFRADLKRLLERARDVSDTVVLTPAPPLAAPRISGISQVALDMLAVVAREECAGARCLFADPFKTLRPAQSAAPSAFARDGVHLENGAALYASLEQDLCPPSPRPGR